MKISEAFFEWWRWAGLSSCVVCHHYVEAGERCGFCVRKVPRRVGYMDRSYALHADRRAGERWRYHRE